MIYFVEVEEKFNKLITVEAETENEALEKCRNALCDPKTPEEGNLVMFDYYKDYSETEFNLVENEEDKINVLTHWNYFEHMR